MATLADRLAARDAERFVGRERELTFFEDLLVDDPPANVVLVHGPGGIGKSTLLREVARRAARAAGSPRVVEGRELAPAPGELERALDGVTAEERPLVVFDTYERMTAVGGWLRQRLLPEMPTGSLVVLSGRRRPDPEWFQGGWERLVVELEVLPFTEDEARALARLHGVDDEETVRAPARVGRRLAAGALARRRRRPVRRVAARGARGHARPRPGAAAPRRVRRARRRRPRGAGGRVDLPRRSTRGCCATCSPRSTPTRPRRGCARGRSPRPSATASRCTTSSARRCAPT